MTTDQKTRASFQRLDHPVDPDPAFAADLRSRFHATAAGQGDAPVVRFRPARSGVRSTRNRTRWLDVAAAAVLLIALSGGLLTLAPRRTDQRPARIQAPMTEPPAVTLGGTAAQDNQYPGPNPAAGNYALSSHLEPSASGTHGPALTYGNRVFVLTMSNSGPFVSTLEAIDLASGKSQWQCELVLDGAFAVAPQGVVATIPATDAATPVPGYGDPPLPSPYHVALLSTETGDVIWESRERYGKSDRVSSPTVLVDQQRIFLLDRLGTIVSLDLNTGDELWRHSYDQTPAPGLDQEICPPNLSPPGNCWPRSDMVSFMAIKGSTVYISDPASATVTALSADDGMERWRIFTPDRVPSKTSVEWLIAFEEGVAIQLGDPEGVGGSPSYLGFWSAMDGSEAWSTESRFGGMASDGTSLFVDQATSEQECCVILRLDPTSGAEVWSARIDSARIYSYLSSGSIILGSFLPDDTQGLPQVARMTGIDPETHVEQWHIQLARNDCFPIFPVADNGDIACLDHGTASVGVYQLTRSSP
jgi:outer membrane protein assembly factor BamB